MGKAYVALSIATLAWAGNFTVAKIATRELDPVFIAAFRVLATAAFFYALLPAGGRSLTRQEVLRVLPLAATGVALNHLCFAAGIKLTTPSHSAVIHALIPVLVAALAWAILGERLRPAGVGGIALAVAGALLVVLGASPAEFRGTIAGDLLTALGILAFSLYTVLGRRVLGVLGSLRTVAWAFVLATPLMAPLLVLGAARQDWTAVTWKGWAALGYMWGGANLVAYAAHLYALKRLKAGQVAAFADLQPVIGIGVAVLAGLDRVTPILLVGAAAALAGVVVVQVRG
ncbi:MAG: DMT family transporter [Planctomycetota bacterium]